MKGLCAQIDSTLTRPASMWCVTLNRWDVRWYVLTEKNTISILILEQGEWCASMQILSNCTDAAWEELRDELRDVDDACCVHKEYASKTKNVTNTMFEFVQTLEIKRRLTIKHCSNMSTNQTPQRKLILSNTHPTNVMKHSRVRKTDMHTKTHTGSTEC